MIESEKVISVYNYCASKGNQNPREYNSELKELAAYYLNKPVNAVNFIDDSQNNLINRLNQDRFGTPPNTVRANITNTYESLLKFLCMYERECCVEIL